MKKWRLLAVGLCLLLAGCQYRNYTEAPHNGTNKTGDAVVEVLPRPEDISGEVAPISGDPLSPDGKWEVRQIGTRKGVTADGTYAPESVQIVDVATECVMWEGVADHRQSVLWSPDGSYLAMTRTARGYGYITIIETAGWNEWDMIPPIGSNIPKYTFLPEANWGEWTDEHQIRLTLGRGGDTGPQTSYRCLLHYSEDHALTATTLEQTVEPLPGEYDFNHDGTNEVLELVTIFDSTGTGQIGWLELSVKDVSGKQLWMEDAGLVHGGWKSIFALQLDGRDYLLRYTPYVSTGIGSYQYCIFSLGENEEIVFEEREVEFDLNFGSQNHQGFNAESLAVFLTDVHRHLDHSVLLLSTDRGEFRVGGSGADFREENHFWDKNCPYDEQLTLEENLQNYEDYMTKLWFPEKAATEFPEEN